MKHVILEANIVIHYYNIMMNDKYALEINLLVNLWTWLTQCFYEPKLLDLLDFNANPPCPTASKTSKTTRQSQL